MATYTCAFQVPAANSTSGSKLIGGFPGSTAPTLAKDDQLQVTVKFLGNQSIPSSLNGYMIISPYQGATNQTTPSPFLNGSNPLCFKSQSGVTGDSTNTFTFAALTYNGGYAGQYELTFVAENPANGVQWSEDPEFDTTG